MKREEAGRRVNDCLDGANASFCGRQDRTTAIKAVVGNSMVKFDLVFMGADAEKVTQGA
jgi:hypothetical protein